MNKEYMQGGMLKSTLILTTLLFLSIAPEPDSRDIADMSANFLVTATETGLMAAENLSPPVQKELIN
ncbi:MAG: hypothetical protein WBN41_14855 [Lysobacterales bacterium]